MLLFIYLLLLSEVNMNTKRKKIKRLKHIFTYQSSYNFKSQTIHGTFNIFIDNSNFDLYKHDRKQYNNTQIIITT